MASTLFQDEPRVSWYQSPHVGTFKTRTFTLCLATCTSPLNAALPSRGKGGGWKIKGSVLAKAGTLGQESMC